MESRIWKLDKFWKGGKRKLLNENDKHKMRRMTEGNKKTKILRS